MPASRFGRLQKASAIVPLALLSAAWTANLAGVGISSASAGEDPDQTLPDGTSVPTEAIEAPASVSSPRGAGLDGNIDQAVANASAMGIPSAALSAYQRAETVINAADTTCNISWQLIAAIGRVESDHGRINGNSLDQDGLATPGIYGIPLDGRNNTARILDSDAGLYDADDKYDRAVGPMQFIPSTWLVVGVDADGDAERNPQDIDDAALASAVYLCSGDDDLSTEAGQRSAIYRYNHSQSYVDLVLSFMNAYLEGDFTSVPNGTTSAGYFVPAPGLSTTSPAGTKSGGTKSGGGGSTGGSGGSTSTTTSGGGGGGGGDTEGPIEEVDPGGTETDNPLLPLPSPSLPGGDGGGDGGGGGGGGTTDPVEDTLTKAEALAKCTAQGVIDNPLTSANELEQCAANLMG